MNDSQQQPPYDPMAGERPLPQSKYIQDSLQNMPQEIRSPHFGDFQKQTNMTNQTEFDNDIGQEQPTIEKDIYSLYRQTVYTGDISHPISISIEEFEQSFKQAVDKYVIGENYLSSSIPLGMPDSILNDYQSKDQLKGKQRLALWGDK